jgi:hypothetical protein
VPELDVRNAKHGVVDDHEQGELQGHLSSTLPRVSRRAYQKRFSRYLVSHRSRPTRESHALLVAVLKKEKSPSRPLTILLKLTMWFQEAFSRCSPCRFGPTRSVVARPKIPSLCACLISHVSLALLASQDHQLLLGFLLCYFFYFNLEPWSLI